MSAPDLSQLRDRFPGLSRTQGGAPCVLADAPGGTQVPRSVIDAMAGYLEHSNSNTHGEFDTSRETDAVIAEARRSAADFLGADEGEIVFGANATSLLFHVSRSIARTVGVGDEIVVTRLDHDANISPWLEVASDTGADIRWVDLRTEDGTLDLDSLDLALGPRTRVVAFTLASNALGTITPAAEIVRRARSVGAIAVADAVHIAQHRSIDAHALGADVLVCSAYKFFGPHLGVLVGRRDRLEEWHPYKARPQSDEAPERFETGTLNHEGLAGLAAAVGYLEEIGRTLGAPAGPGRRDALVAAMEAIRGHEAVLSNRFLEGLIAVPAARAFGIGEVGRVDERTPTFAIRLGDRHPLETAKLLGDRGIYVWDGHYYALAVMEALGLLESGGAVRIGFCHYHSTEEVDRVLAELEALS